MEFLLGLQAGGTTAAFLRHERAERVFLPLAVVGQLPRFDGPQRDRQSGGFAEGAFVILVNLRVRQCLRQIVFAVHIDRFRYRR